VGKGLLLGLTTADVATWCESIGVDRVETDGAVLLLVALCGVSEGKAKKTDGWDEMSKDDVGLDRGEKGFGVATAEGTGELIETFLDFCLDETTSVSRSFD
jgi:hypothetical protein